MHDLVSYVWLSDFIKKYPDFWKGYESFYREKQNIRCRTLSLKYYYVREKIIFIQINVKVCHVIDKILQGAYASANFQGDI